MIQEIIEEQVKKNPDRIFCKFYQDNQIDIISIKDFYNLALNYISKDIPFGLNLIIKKSSIETMAIFLGRFLAGAKPAMLSHPNIKEHKLDYQNKIKNIIDTLKPTRIFCDEELDFELKLQEKQYTNNNYKSFIQFSSGSTGLQKGVEITEEMLMKQIESYSKELSIDKDSKIFSWLPLYHDMGLITSFLMPLILGIEIDIMSPFEWVSNPEKMFQYIEENKCTHCWIPNFAFNFLTKNVENKYDLSSLKMLINCGEPCYATSMREFSEKFQFKNITTCYAMAENVFAISQGMNENFEPLTKILSDVEIKLAEDGEILINSQFTSNHYYNGVYTLDRNNFFATGDIGEIIDGKLKIIGRKKDLIIIEGRNIFPNDLENVINNISIPGRNVVLGKFNSKRGTEEIIVIAEVEKYDLKISKEIRKTIYNQFNTSPSQVLLVPKGWLRKTSSGKIARKPNLEKLEKHNELITKIKEIAKEINSEFNLDPDEDFIESGLFSSLDIYSLTLAIENKLNISMSGSYGIYGENNNTIRKLVFFIEKKMYDF